MPSHLNAYLLCAAMLAALLHCAPGAPLQVALPDSPAGDPSGEEGETTAELLSDSQVWNLVLGPTDNHQREFEAEFQNVVNYHFLENYRISSLPESCPYSNFSQEACLHRLVQGLLIYRVLLKRVETEYPSSSTLPGACGLLINWLNDNMRNPEQVTELTSSQEERLLKDLDNPNAFHRKMTAHSILFQLRDFILKGKRAIKKRELKANRSIAPVSVYHQV